MNRTFLNTQGVEGDITPNAPQTQMEKINRFKMKKFFEEFDNFDRNGFTLFWRMNIELKLNHGFYINMLHMYKKKQDIL